MYKMTCRKWTVPLAACIFLSDTPSASPSRPSCLRILHLSPSWNGNKTHIISRQIPARWNFMISCLCSAQRLNSSRADFWFSGKTVFPSQNVLLNCFLIQCAAHTHQPGQINNRETVQLNTNILQFILRSFKHNVWKIVYFIFNNQVFIRNYIVLIQQQVYFCVLFIQVGLFLKHPQAVYFKEMLLLCLSYKCYDNFRCSFLSFSLHNLMKTA